jgi:hypothetical protein
VTVIEIKVIKSDWSDQENPTRTSIHATNFDDGAKGAYYLDLVHNVRIWILVKEELK